MRRARARLLIVATRVLDLHHECACCGFRRDQIVFVTVADDKVQGGLAAALQQLPPHGAARNDLMQQLSKHE